MQACHSRNSRRFPRREMSLNVLILFDGWLSMSQRSLGSWMRPPKMRGHWEDADGGEEQSTQLQGKMMINGGGTRS
jgi:hypothetical protein